MSDTLVTVATVIQITVCIFFWGWYVWHFILYDQKNICNSLWYRYAASRIALVPEVWDSNSASSNAVVFVYIYFFSFKFVSQQPAGHGSVRWRDCHDQINLINLYVHVTAERMVSEWNHIVLLKFFRAEIVTEGLSHRPTKKFLYKKMKIEISRVSNHWEDAFYCTYLASDHTVNIVTYLGCVTRDGVWIGQ